MYSFISLIIFDTTENEFAEREIKFILIGLSQSPYINRFTYMSTYVSAAKCEFQAEG